MSPPLPPSPPEGPPRGTYFSLRKATQPLPPSPALIEIFASSANTGHLLLGKLPENHTPGLGVKIKIRARVTKRVSEIVTLVGCCRRLGSGRCGVRAANRGF